MVKTMDRSRVANRNQRVNHVIRHQYYYSAEKWTRLAFLLAEIHVDIRLLPA